jgi:hypothetical protein
MKISRLSDSQIVTFVKKPFRHRVRADHPAACQRAGRNYPQLEIMLSSYAIHKPTYFRMGFWFTLVFPVSNSTAVALRSRPPTAHVGVAPVRGAATYWVPGR